MSERGDSKSDDSKTLTTIDWKKETILVIFSAIIGGVVFSAVSPFIVPTIHDIQVYHLGVEKPSIGIEVEYAENIDGSRFSVPANESYDRYTVTVQNPSRKRVSTLTIGLVFPGVIEAQGVGLTQPEDGISYSRNAWLVATDSSDNFSYASNALKVDELPPLKEVSATFLIDRTPEKAPIPGYWETSGLTRYNASRGTMMVSGQYRWQFKGSYYTELRQYTLLNVSHEVTPNRYDLCIGGRRRKICGQ